MPTNLERMLALVEEVFSVRDDPTQLRVDETVLARLQRMHPATVGEHDDGHGPVAWLLLMPTTTDLMEAFARGNLTEQQLYERTPEHGPYEALYLCSALVLPEYRRTGIILRLMARALSSIRKDHPIHALFVWPFTPEGRAAAMALARAAGLPLRVRAHA